MSAGQKVRLVDARCPECKDRSHVGIGKVEVRYRFGDIVPVAYLREGVVCGRCETTVLIATEIIA
jgi:hypothetical protein